MDIGATVGAIVFLGSLVVWAVRQEGRVNNHDHELEQLAKRDAEITLQAEDRVRTLRDEFRQRHDEVRKDLAYIRDRIDRAIGNHDPTR